MNNFNGSFTDMIARREKEEDFWKWVSLHSANPDSIYLNKGLGIKNILATYFIDRKFEGVYYYD
jgi:hypothetical protein